MNIARNVKGKNAIATCHFLHPLLFLFGNLWASKGKLNSFMSVDSSLLWGSKWARFEWYLWVSNAPQLNYNGFFVDPVCRSKKHFSFQLTVRKVWQQWSEIISCSCSFHARSPPSLDGWNVAFFCKKKRLFGGSFRLSSHNRFFLPLPAPLPVLFANCIFSWADVHCSQCSAHNTTDKRIVFHLFFCLSEQKAQNHTKILWNRKAEGATLNKIVAKKSHKKDILHKKEDFFSSKAVWVNHFPFCSPKIILIILLESSSHIHNIHCIIAVVKKW